MIDVIIPTKNCAMDLRDCLESLMVQIVPVNIIVVDANSDDGTRETALEYGALLVDEPPSKIVGSRRGLACNEGLKHSKSEYVGFLDSDTIIPKCWSRVFIKYFSNPEVAAVTSGCVENKGSRLGYAINRGIGFFSTHGNSFKEESVIDSCPGYNSVYRRSVIDEVGGFNAEIGGCEDWELNKRIRDKGYKILGLPICPVIHKERKTAKAFNKQMNGYAWSRARLAKATGNFSLFHALPTLFFLGLILWWPYGVLINIASLFVRNDLILVLDRYGEKLPRRLTMFLVLCLMGVSWSYGYVKGVIE